mgnify:CR=1 FL=1
MGKSATSKDIRFVDPTADPAIIFDVLERLANAGLDYTVIRVLQEMVWRFPSKEYAVGFDGVDDWVSVPKLKIRRSGLEVETRIWVAESEQYKCLLAIGDQDDDRIFGLFSSSATEGEISAVYSDRNDFQNRVLQGFKPQTWHDLRLWSDGAVFSVEIDGKQIALIHEAKLKPGPFTFNFGSSFPTGRYFEGMIKHLRVRSGPDTILDIEAGQEVQINDKPDSALIAGIHDMKKGRFQSEFQA